MTQSVVLKLPDGVYQPIHRIAEQMHEPVENVLLRALQVSLPSLDGLPEDVVEQLTRLEALNDAQLGQILLETVSTQRQEQLETLLLAQQDQGLTVSEKERLADLQGEARLVMLRKARAAVLLRFRGNALPTLDQLRRVAVADKA